MEWISVRLDWSDGGSTTVDVSHAGYEALLAEGILRGGDDGVMIASEDAVDDVMAYARHVIGRACITAPGRRTVDAHTVKEALRLAEEGLLQKQIADRLNAEGHRTSRGTLITQMHVSDLLLTAGYRRRSYGVRSH